MTSQKSTRKCETCGRDLELLDACIWNALTNKFFCGDTCAKMYLRVRCTECSSTLGEECVGKAVHPARYDAVQAYVPRLRATPIEELIDRSSLGTPRAKYLRAKADPTTVKKILLHEDVRSRIEQLERVGKEMRSVIEDFLEVVLPPYGERSGEKVEHWQRNLSDIQRQRLVKLWPEFKKTFPRKGE